MGKPIPTVFILSYSEEFKIIGHHPLERFFGSPTVIRRSQHLSLIAIGGFMSFYVCAFSEEKAEITCSFYYKKLMNGEVRDISFLSDSILVISADERYLTEIKLNVD